MYSSFTGLALKIVGLIMILSSLLDYLVLIIPSPGISPLESSWQLNLTTQLVDRGVIPMVGIAFLVAGYWISNNSGGSLPERKSSISDLRFWAFLLSSLLGLLFLLLVPLHFNNVRIQSNQAINQIGQQAEQAETQLGTQVDQIGALLQDPQQLERLDQAIESGQAQGEQLARLQALREQLMALRQDPDAIAKRTEEAQTQIRGRKQELEQRARVEALKTGIRIGLSSLLLAIGYSIIGWMGLRNLGS
ncbi:hormogonium polysaccharide biosynthesis protein HpsJ [Coleofasciculus sp. G1-WW12-02]|uniref:hormogonium polysaccharide biosynthesis protein HpsJ n=1 Tax=Coleofasciculus sp. G1-WW12-02 TaxID=3068483 RepID=UPI0040628BF3